MQKKSLVAAAVIAACGAQSALAQSSITVQGLIDLNVQSIKRSGAGYPSTDQGTQTVVDSNGMTTSWLGIGGSESLGGKLRASFALQGFFRPDTGEVGRFGTTDGLFKKTAWVGLEHGDFGRAQLGRQTTQYFLATVQTNPFGDSFGFGPSMLNIFGTSLGPGLGVRYPRDRFLLGDSGWSNAIQYTTPTLAGVTGGVMWSGNSASNGQEDGTQSGRAISGVLTYRGGPLVATGVYQDLRPNAVDQQQKAWMLGAAYDLKVVRLFAQYHDMDTKQAAGTDADSGWQLGATVPFGSHNILASYFKMETEAKTGPATKEDRTTWALGYRYEFSRRTDGYVVYLSDDLSAAAEKKRTSFGAGLRHRF